MPVPTHGPWCHTRTWPTSCPTCGASVFFFSCSCGSKVFFDDLGTPWPIHLCDTSWTRSLKRTTSPDGKTVVELFPGTTVTRLPEDFAVDESVIAFAVSLKEWSAPIVAIQPSGEVEPVFGVLRELIPRRDAMKVYRLPDTAVSRAILGPLASGEWGQITIHSPQSDGVVLASYTAWIPSAWLADSRVIKGLTIGALLQPLAILGRDSVWVCLEFEIAG